MGYMGTLKIFLILIFITGALNFTYANGGPIIGENQAKIAAQNYLDSHNLHYIAIIPGWDKFQVKAKDTKTGKIKWIPVDVAEEDFISGEYRYELFNGIPYWIVQINNKNKKNVGRIYVDVNTGEVLKVVINGKVLKDIIDQREQLIEDSYNSTPNYELKDLSETNENPLGSTDIIDMNNSIIHLPQGLSGNITEFFALIVVLIFTGTIYWIFEKILG